LVADGLSRSFGDRRVLVDLDLTVAAGTRLGVIGENGAGKSTLLRLLAGADDPDAGRLARPARTGFLPQEPPFAPDADVRAVIEAAQAGVRRIERELAEAGAALADADDAADVAAAEERYSAALAAAERAEVWSADARCEATLDGLGLSGVPGDRSIRRLSGGQRSRLALAALLVARPDALVLDEPTNHLDDDAVEFLQSALLGWRGPVVFASHDRAFLDRVATGLLDLDPQAAPLSGAGGASWRAVRHTGGYTDYLAAKADARTRWERRYATEQAELSRLRRGAAETARTEVSRTPTRDNDKFIAAFKAGRKQAQASRAIADARRRAEVLEREQVAKPPAQLSFAGIPAAHHALDATDGLLVQAAEIAVPGRLALGEFTIAAGDRVLVSGANGAGKSTLLALVAGRLAPAAGRIHRRRGLRVGLLEQDVRFADPAESPRAVYGRMLGERRAETVPLVSLGLIAPRDLDRPVGALSVGQQRRLALALIIARPPHLFLLDEPTNHLSLSLAEELEEALGRYPGAVVVASHDRWLRSHWVGREVPLAAAA